MTQTNEQIAGVDHRIGPRGRFTLRQASGEVTIRGVEGDTVRVRSLDDEDRALTDIFEIETGDGFVELRQRDKSSSQFTLGKLRFSRGDSPEIEVEVPHGATVSVETASAEVEASDLSGAKHFRTASGELSLDRFAGSIEIETVSGDVEIDGQAPIDLALKSISGDVRVRVPRLRRLDLGTTSGDIWLDGELAGEGPFAVRSISGDTTIVGRGGFRVEAETITGDLSSDVPHKRESLPGRKVLVIGRPGPTLSFRSVSGDFEVVQPRDAAPASTPAAPALVSTDVDTMRLEILRELERGQISVAEATDRLGKLDEVLR